MYLSVSPTTQGLPTLASKRSTRDSSISSIAVSVGLGVRVDEDAVHVVTLVARDAFRADQDQERDLGRVLQGIEQSHAAAHRVASKSDAVDAELRQDLAHELDHRLAGVDVPRNSPGEAVGREVDADNPVALDELWNPGLPVVQRAETSVYQHERRSVRRTLVAIMDDGAARQLQEAGVGAHVLAELFAGQIGAEKHGRRDRNHEHEQSGQAQGDDREPAPDPA